MSLKSYDELNKIRIEGHMSLVTTNDALEFLIERHQKQMTDTGNEIAKILKEAKARIEDYLKRTY